MRGLKNEAINMRAVGNCEVHVWKAMPRHGMAWTQRRQAMLIKLKRAQSRGNLSLSRTSCSTPLPAVIH